MGFLDSSGDIILDAVLTDEGRRRLSKGDGSFKITKFSVSDDEIDYDNYDPNAGGGSSQYDLEILKTPIGEPISDNTSALKYRMVSLNRDDYFYLPVLKKNELFNEATKTRDTGDSSGMFIVAVNQETEDILFTDSNTSGYMRGATPNKGGSYIRVDQGLDTEDVPPGRSLESELVETQYIVQVDNRFASVVNTDDAAQAQPSSIDDDEVANYYFTLSTDPAFVNDNDSTEDTGQAIAGPRGTFIEFRLQSSLELSASDALFDSFGGQITQFDGNFYNYIDSIIRVVGGNTGASVDVPVRFVRLV